MAYTEIKQKNGKKYYYRARSIREGKKFKKQRIYLGKNLDKKEIFLKKREADKILGAKKNEKKLKEISRIIPKIKEILIRNKIKKAGLFGSYARGEQKKNSDIDILIQPARNMSLLDISGLKIELEEILGKKIDLISYNYIHPHLKKGILESEIKLI